MENKNIIVRSVFGSHLYGTETENSDHDYKGIYLPSKGDCFLNRVDSNISETTGKANSKNTKEDVDIDKKEEDPINKVKDFIKGYEEKQKTKESKKDN